METRQEARIYASANKCRNRGGDCPCQGPCQAVEAIDERLEELESDKAVLDHAVDELKRTRHRLTSPMATLRADFSFDDRYKPVMVFDGDEASFGHENSDGEWFETNVWPFNERFVWFDDCERLGIYVVLQ